MKFLQTDYTQTHRHKKLSKEDSIEIDNLISQIEVLQLVILRLQQLLINILYKKYF